MPHTYVVCEPCAWWLLLCAVDVELTPCRLPQHFSCLRTTRPLSTTVRVR